MPILIDIQKLTCVMGAPYNCDDEEDPVRNTIIKMHGTIIKVLIMSDGTYVTICEGK